MIVFFLFFGDRRDDIAYCDALAAQTADSLPRTPVSIMGIIFYYLRSEIKLELELELGDGNKHYSSLA